MTTNNAGLLTGKVAVVYGAGGAIGGTVARAFAREGARVFLTGRRLEPVAAAASEIALSGGSAEAAAVDALDEGAVDAHLETVLARAGRIDVSFNAVGLPNAQMLGVPFTELAMERFVQPIADYTRSFFLTARLAARRMVPKKAGTILTVSAIPGRAGTPLNGGYGPAMAAKEAMVRDLSAELAPHGLRVIGLRSHGVPETPMIRKLYELKAQPAGMSWEQFQAYLANWGHARRSLRLDEVGAMAALLASDRASGLTGTIVNLTLGGVAD